MKVRFRFGLGACGLKMGSFRNFFAIGLVVFGCYVPLRWDGGT